MSLLCVYPDERDPRAHRRHTSFEEIVRVAAEAGIRFERWTADRPLAADASPPDILAAYGDAVARLKRERGFATEDVIRLRPDDPNRGELRKKFLREHTHSEDEVRFFVEGSGLFCIHHERSVYALLCERGDLINVPAGTRHWFDMGPAPCFTAIRLFTDPAGWVAAFTGSEIAERFPLFGESRESLK